MKMGRKMMIVVVVAMIMEATTSAGRPVHDDNKPCVVRGRVYCDPCAAGFETPASTYLHGAKVSLECRDRNTQQLLYWDEAETDKDGSYSMRVNEDQKNRVCDAILVSSPDRECSNPDPGRDRSRVVLTSYNGMLSSDRYANNLGFMRHQPMAFCSQLLKQYELDEDQV